MSFRRLISVGLLAASAAVLPALPGQAAPSTGSCDGSYPTNATQLSLSVTASTITIGRTITAFGALRKNACAIKGATVVIRSKSVVDGTPIGRWSTVKTVTTDRNGLFLATTAPRINTLLQAHFAPTAGFVGANSDVLVRVRTAISEAATKRPACKITLTGGTRPMKVDAPVAIQKRGPRGQFHGWTTFARGRTNIHGRYSINKAATCGTRYNLSALIGKDATNIAGRSATLFGIKATR